MKRMIGFALLTVGLLIVSGSQTALLAEQEAKVISMYDGPDGLAYFKEVPIKYSEITKLAGGMQFARTKPAPPPDPKAPINFRPGPNRRYAVTLSGKAIITASGGQTQAVDREHIILVEDLKGKGHSLRVIGPEDWVRIYLDIDPPVQR